MPERTEVLIAGAGPAGAVAALVLARAGVRVRLLDRARFPRDKLCGDTVNPGTLAVLGRLGVGRPVERRGLALGGMLVTGPGGVAVRGDYGRPGDPSPVVGRALVRRELDLMLVEAAVGAGAQLDDGVTIRGPVVVGAAGGRVTGVEVVTGRGRATLGARVVIAADGRASTLGSALGLVRRAPWPRRWVVGGYFGGVTGLGAWGEMHVRRDHFIGVAPIADGVANVCVVSAHRRSYARPASWLCQALAGDPLLRDRFAGARPASGVASLGPLAVDAMAAGALGLLLAGDAAGFIDPITGDGLRFAIRGGELAADAALEMLATGRTDGHTRLARRRRAEFGAKWRFNRAVRGLTGAPGGVAAASLAARGAPALLRRLVRYAGDADAAARPA